MGREFDADEDDEAAANDEATLQSLAEAYMAGDANTMQQGIKVRTSSSSSSSSSSSIRSSSSSIRSGGV